MDKIRIIALDDDNHDTYFSSENGQTFDNPRELVLFLAKPHEVEYEVRGFALCDYDDELEASESEVDMMFSAVAGNRTYEDFPFEKSFETLWAYSSEWWH